jgi:predicted nucleic acid-binding protein
VRLVADTNILFSFFWKKSLSRKIMSSDAAELFSPEFALEEINAYESEICRKTGLSKGEFRESRKELALLVGFVPVEEYRRFFKSLLSVPDKDDIDFLALALHIGCPIWSQDKALKRQGAVTVYSTAELLPKLQ